MGQQAGQVVRGQRHLVVDRLEMPSQFRRRQQAAIVAAETGGEGVQTQVRRHVPDRADRDSRVEPRAECQAQLAPAPGLKLDRSQEAVTKPLRLYRLGLLADAQLQRPIAAGHRLGPAQLQAGAGQQRTDPLEEGAAGIGLFGAVQVVDGVAVGPRGHVAQSQQRLVLRGERPPVAGARDVEELGRQRVAEQQEPLARSVPERHGELPPDPSQAFLAIAMVEGQEQLRVGDRGSLVGPDAEHRQKFGTIVEEPGERERQARDLGCATTPTRAEMHA